MSVDCRLWGKAAGLGKDARGVHRTHPLICHLLDTAAVAEVSCPRFRGVPEARLMILARRRTTSSASTT